MGVGFEAAEPADRDNPGTFDQTRVGRANHTQQATDFDVHRIDDRRGRHHTDAARGRHSGPVNNHAHRAVKFFADVLDGIVAANVANAGNDVLVGCFGEGNPPAG